MKTRTKWILLSLIVLSLILIGISRYYIYVMKDRNAEEQVASAAAAKAVGLTEITKTVKSVWDEVIYVVIGKDASQKEMFVWVKDGKVLYHAPSSAGTSEAKIRAIIQQQMPNITLERVIPGIYNNQYVWQVFYKDGDHYMYRFYNFADGKALEDVFTLPNS
ncbi:uncharacterized protein YpmB [Paenibacillus shirakamiensis]|uniref:Uncharacterized protein YpmB n=1 Tax=Paenibacillus shirakamiensis TaxID=1265935 RepID=A0ABS4JCZ5_9BACL|nr:DUF5590 domain-containing protein [Paenibacillus shirakamiensis]MBP1999582.1 uncharacterized protein YpmB [Paenibacillus shirakamiensis]